MCCVLEQDTLPKIKHLNYHTNGVARTLKKITHIKGRLLYQAVIQFSCIPFIMGSSLKGKILLPEGVNSFL